MTRGLTAQTHFARRFDKHQPGQTVKVSLVKPKADKEKDKNAAAEERKPQVAMIVIVAEAPLNPAPAK